MERLKRLSFGRGLVVLGAVAAQLLLVSGVAAAGGAIARPPGALDDRGWELVSETDTSGSQVTDGTAHLSSDGSRVLYGITGGAPNATAGAYAQVLAVRKSAGWVSQVVMPPRTAMVATSYFDSATTPELSRWIASGFDGLGTSADSPGVSLVRLDDQGDQTVLHAFPVFFGASGIPLVTSDDLAHVFATVPERIDPSQQFATSDVYDFGSGAPQLVSVMSATGKAPACGVDTSEFANVNDGTKGWHWVSTDGSQVFFQSRGDAAGCTAPSRLYLRDRSTATTTSISGPALPGDTEFDADFVQAAPNGSWAIFRTATSLDPADDADGDSTDVDVYKWTAGAGSQCLTCAVPNADVDSGTDQVAASESGSHVYFASQSVLGDAPPGTPAGTPDAPNLYVVAGGAVHFITRISGDTSVTNNATKTGYVTPDGNVFVFASDRPELNALTGSDNGGLTQVYRYDDRERGDAHGGVTCLSCSPGGTPTPVGVDSETLGFSVQSFPAAMRAATDDGSEVFFGTSSALVPEDVNQGPDLYEWHSGTVKLITSGLMRYSLGRGAATPHFGGVSADGSDVLFRDSAQLTWDAQAGPWKEYDARVGGGFAPPSATPSCEGDQCLGQPTPPPVLGEPASSTLSDVGNAKLPPRFSVGRIAAAQRARLAATGGLALKVSVGASGRVSAFAQAKIGHAVRVVARAARSARHKGTVTLTLRLSRAARAQLARSRRLQVVIAVRYSKVAVVKRLTLTLTAHRRRA